MLKQSAKKAKNANKENIPSVSLKKRRTLRFKDVQNSDSSDENLSPFAMEVYKDFKEFYLQTPTVADLKRELTVEQLEELCLRQNCRVLMERWNLVRDYEESLRKKGRLENKNKRERTKLVIKAVRNHVKYGKPYTEEQIERRRKAEWADRKRNNILCLELWEYDRKNHGEVTNCSEDSTINDMEQVQTVVEQQEEVVQQEEIEVEQQEEVVQQEEIEVEQQEEVVQQEEIEVELQEEVVQQEEIELEQQEEVGVRQYEVVEHEEVVVQQEEEECSENEEQQQQEKCEIPSSFSQHQAQKWFKNYKRFKRIHQHEVQNELDQDMNNNDEPLNDIENIVKLEEPELQQSAAEERLDNYENIIKSSAMVAVPTQIYNDYNSSTEFVEMLSNEVNLPILMKSSASETIINPLILILNEEENQQQEKVPMTQLQTQCTPLSLSGSMADFWNANTESMKEVVFIGTNSDSNSIPTAICYDEFHSQIPATSTSTQSQTQNATANCTQYSSSQEIIVD